ncbi:hypothetical protein TWF718_007780 [Orbilia javanica]|uniref:Uncharacterized protein n=1 Tax=Orbilia javanica TaxID=47235 RepID=A0AAN8MM62_9PEZI
MSSIQGVVDTAWSWVVEPLAELLGFKLEVEKEQMASTKPLEIMIPINRGDASEDAVKFSGPIRVVLQHQGDPTAPTTRRQLVYYNIRAGYLLVCYVALTMAAMGFFQPFMQDSTNYGPYLFTLWAIIFLSFGYYTLGNSTGPRSFHELLRLCFWTAMAIGAATLFYNFGDIYGDQFMQWIDKSILTKLGIDPIPLNPTTQPTATTSTVTTTVTFTMTGDCANSQIGAPDPLDGGTTVSNFQPMMPPPSTFSTTQKIGPGEPSNSSSTESVNFGNPQRQMPQ